MSDYLFSEIEQSLCAYSPAAEIEKNYLKDFEDLLSRGTQVLWSDFFDPGHVTASGYVLSPDKKSLLMILHNKIQRWLQPGGHLEKLDASLLTAVQREVFEETGIQGITPLSDGIFDLDIHEISARKGKPTHLHYDIRLVLHAHSTDFVTTPEAPEVQWVPLNRAKDTFTDSSLLRPVHKLLDLVNGAPTQH